MKLKCYLADIGMTMKDFSQLVQCNHRYMSRIMNGHAKPGKRLARDIEELTDGQVKLLHPAKENVASAQKYAD